MKPIDWINSTLRNPETGEPFELLPCEIAFLDRCLELDDEGRAVYPEQTYSAPMNSLAFAPFAVLWIIFACCWRARIRALRAFLSSSS
jgi:hypothetical protein